MATTNEIARNVIVVGNGIVTTIAFQFNYLQGDPNVEIVVTKKDTTTLIETVLVLNTNYIISGSSIILSVPLPTGTNLLIERRTRGLQVLDYETSRPFPAEVTEDSSDRIYFLLCELRSVLTRAAFVGKFEDPNLRVNLPTPVNGQYLAWDGIGGNIKNANTTIDPLLLTSVDMTFDNTTSTLASANVQSAIDELDVKVEANELTLLSKVETSSNSGAGQGLALPKVGVDLPFKSIASQTELLDVIATPTEVRFDLPTEGDGFGDVVTLKRIVTTGAWAYQTVVEKNNWSIAFGDGVFVAVSNGGTNRCMRSTDLGLTWAAVVIPVQDYLTLTFGSGVFIAVANSGTTQITRSTDLGLTWSTVVTTNLAFAQIVFNKEVNNFYTRHAGVVRVSDDLGLTWSAFTTTFSATSITTGKGLLLCFRANNVEVFDLVNGTPSFSVVTSGTLSNCFYGNGIFVANNFGSISTSPDGINWTFRAFFTLTGFDQGVYGNGLFVMMRDEDAVRCVVSRDGITWTSLSIAATTWKTIAFGEGVFVSLPNTGAATEYSARLVPTVVKELGTSTREGIQLRGPIFCVASQRTTNGTGSSQDIPADDGQFVVGGASRYRRLNNFWVSKDSSDYFSFVDSNTETAGIVINKTGNYRLEYVGSVSRTGLVTKEVIRERTAVADLRVAHSKTILSTTGGAIASETSISCAGVAQLNAGDKVRVRSFLVTKTGNVAYGNIFVADGQSLDFCTLTISLIEDL